MFTEEKGEKISPRKQGGFQERVEGWIKFGGDYFIFL